MFQIGRVQSLVDLAKENGIKSPQIEIVELLSKESSVVNDMAWRQGNLLDGHKFTVRAQLPEIMWHIINRGMKPSVSRIAEVTETCGIMKALAQIDAKQLELADNPAVERMIQSLAYVEAMNQEFVNKLFYGNAALQPETITGLAVRYGNLADPSINKYIIDAGGTGPNLTSVYLVCWGPRTVYGIVPKNYVTGLQHKPSQGLVTLHDDDGLAFQGYEDWWYWNVGLCVEDHRQVVRICNIDTDALKTWGQDGSNAADLRELLDVARIRIQKLSNGRPVFYCNRTIMEAWHQQVLTRSKLDVTVTEGGLGQGAAAQVGVSYFGIPIHMEDALLDTEQRVV